jgi:hypothetical protein
MGMKREEDPQLWDLLGRSKGAAAPSPFFARNVVRAARAEIPESDGLSGWFNLRRLVPALSAAAAVAIAAFTFQVLQRQGSPHRGLTTAEVQDSDVAADLDLLASNDDDDDTSLL